MTLLCGDVIEMLKTIPDGTVQTCVTSPPYYGLRDYGIDGQIGLEQSPDEYVKKLVEVFREVKRVLRDDGTLWLNLGDSYAGSGEGGGGNRKGNEHGQHDNCVGKRPGVPTGLKPKDLIGIPWLVAFALRADGWYLRSDIIWAKPNPMPESVKDRPTKSHEYIFLLSKSQHYFYDAEAVKEPFTSEPEKPRDKSKEGYNNSFTGGRWSEGERDYYAGGGRNSRSVWTITTKPFKGAHFAVFPPEIPEKCIKAGTSEKGCCPKCGSPWERIIEKVDAPNQNPRPFSKAGNKDRNDTGDIYKEMVSVTTGWQPSCSCNLDPVPCVVLDPFNGAGTTGMVAKTLGRDYIGIDLNPSYIAMSEKRIAKVAYQPEMI